MKVIVSVTSHFKREAKPLLKKYKSLASDLSNLESALIANPTLGTSLGNNAYKIRLKINSKSKGKSGGARVITYLETEIVANFEIEGELTTVNLISIYDKSEMDSIPDKELRALIANLR